MESQISITKKQLHFTAVRAYNEHIEQWLRIWWVEGRALKMDLPGKDGKLRWVYEFNLYRNPTILLLLYKIFFFIVLGIYLFMVILTAFDDGMIKAATTMWPVFLYPLIFIFALISFSYLLYALIMGGKYCVLFEMDEKGINHIQLPKQFKKAQIMGLIATLAGAAAGSPAAMGAGLLAAGRQSMYSEYKKIRSVKPYRKRQVIKLRSSDLMHNQIYADAEDFNFVLNYIQTRVDSAQQSRQIQKTRSGHSRGT